MADRRVETLMDRGFDTTRPVSTASMSVGRIGVLAVALGVIPGQVVNA
jgi:hypothetical protein